MENDVIYDRITIIKKGICMILMNSYMQLTS